MVPSRTDASNVKTTSTLPSAFSAVNVVLEVTFLPSIKIGSPVSLFISAPVMVYFLPGSKEEYLTVSMIVACGFASVWLIFVAASSAFVRIFGR